jgi:dTDP-4-amino-4,6-dideoxygalactose transaminase
MISVSEPNLAGNERLYLTQAIDSGWVSGGGAYTVQFEEAVARAVGRRWAVATVTGTMALMVALKATGCVRDDSVLMPSMTFIAAANAIDSLGAVPHFYDIDESWTPDFARIGPYVIDAAPAIARTDWPDFWRDTWAGELAILSFNGNKTVTTGQGGAVVGDAWDDYKRVLHLANLAKVRDYEFDAIGFNARMANVNAAIGCAQMERLEGFREAKASIMQRYRSAGFTVVGSAWMALWRLPSPVDRRSVITHLAEAGIKAKPFYTPLHLRGPYETNSWGRKLPETEALWQRLVCLPCSTGLSQADQDRVIEACAKYLQ